MTAVIRKQLVTISAVFNPACQPYPCGPTGPYPCGDDDYSTVPPNPPCPPYVPPTQPTSAVAQLNFCSLTGQQVSTTIPMTLGSNGFTWSCTWDSSACGGGLVTWVVYASGVVQAAAQGQFVVLANSANNF